MNDYRDDDQTVGYCPVCSQPLSALTVADKGYCELHGWVFANWYRHEEFKQAVGDLFHKMEKVGE